MVDKVSVAFTGFWHRPPAWTGFAEASKVFEKIIFSAVVLYGSFFPATVLSLHLVSLESHTVDTRVVSVRPTRLHLIFGSRGSNTGPQDIPLKMPKMKMAEIPELGRGEGSRAPKCGSGPNCPLEVLPPSSHCNWRTLPSSPSPSPRTLPPSSFDAPVGAQAGVGEGSWGGGQWRGRTLQSSQKG